MPNEDQQQNEPPPQRSMTVMQPATETALAVQPIQMIEPWQDDATYAQMSITPVTEAQAEILTAPVDSVDIDIKPDGSIYLNHAKYRARLNQAFRPMGWALRRYTAYMFDDNAGICYAEFALYAEGRFVSMATGEMRLHDNNDNMSKGDVLEGVKSNALTRCCKDLGIAAELWDRSFADAWREANCVKVWVERRDGKAKPQWRKVDAPFIYGETGICSDSPNRDKYVQPEQRQRRSEPRQDAPRPQQQADGRTQRAQGTPAPQQQQRSPASASPQQRPSSGGGRVITDRQLARLHSIRNEEGISESMLAEYLQEQFNHNDPARLTMGEQYDGVIDWLKGGSEPAEGAPE